MKKLLITFAIMLVGLNALAAVKYNDNKWDISIFDQRSMDAVSGTGKIITGVYTFVYDAGTKTLSTLYADTIRTALANPITRAQFASDDRIKFWSASTTHDIVIAHSDGSVAKYASVTLSNHQLAINRDGVDKVLIVPFAFIAGGTEVDTGIDLPLNVWVRDVMIEVVTLDATETIDIGLLSSEANGNPNGFMEAATVASAGFVKNTSVDATNGYIDVVTTGALLGKGIVGSSTASNWGFGHVEGHIVSGANARSLTYTPSTSDTMAGYIYVYFRHLR